MGLGEPVDEVGADAEEHGHLRKDDEECQIVREPIDGAGVHVILLFFVILSLGTRVSGTDKNSNSRKEVYH